jgi:beta-glucosidase
MTKMFVSIASMLFLAATIRSAAQTQPPYKNPKLPVKARVADLLKRMTLEEKVAQLECETDRSEALKYLRTNNIGGVGTFSRDLSPKLSAEASNRIQSIACDSTRLGIPVIWHDEGVHGLIGKGATSFPQAIGLAATWDTSLVSSVAHVIGRQTRARGIRQLLSPVINIVRDVRWGRVEETYGEDPYLSARLGVAFCSAVESEGVVSTPKHFVYNVSDGGRDSYPANVSERYLREVDFVPFQACITEAHSGSLMASYNSYDGTPASSNYWLLTDILRKEWGFTGFVVSDYGSVSGTLDMHMVAASPADGAALTLNAGLDMELPEVDFYGKPLLEAVKKGIVKEAVLNQAVSRILESKFRLGLFDNPYVDSLAADKIGETPSDRALAHRAALEALVLLKNEGNILPLHKSVKTVAVLGPNADSKYLGGYSGDPDSIVTILQGIKDEIPSANVLYQKGCNLGGIGYPAIPTRYLTPAGGSAGAHGLKGEYYNNMFLSGQPAVVRTDSTIAFEWGNGSPDPKIQVDSFSVVWSGALTAPATGKFKMSVTSDDGIRVTFAGKRVVDSWRDRSETADYFSVFLDSGKQYDVRIEYYEHTGGAAASFGWSYQGKENSMLASAVAAAKRADVAIIVAGIIEGEGRDRADLNLPADQEELINAVAATNVPTFVVLNAGGAITLKNWIDNVPGVLDCWYAGEDGGNAVAEALFGDSSPGGKLPMTFPQTVGQVPLYYNHHPTGRGNDYVTISGKPEFAFGFGLSYASFAYANMKVTPASMSDRDTVDVSADIRNTGNIRADEVAQLYIHDSCTSVTRPVEELKGFARVSLDPGASATVHFKLAKKQLGFYNQQMKFVMEPGPIQLMIGAASDDIRLRDSVIVISSIRKK